MNLALHVTGRRADGYHTLDSLAVFSDAADVLTAEAADGLTLTVTGPFGATLATEPDNLVLRAARVLAELAGVPARARLTLDKRLPVASGIGGGSADAAATLRAVSRLWGVTADLAGVAARLGADVPVCVGSRPARMRGVGDVLDAVPPLPEFDLVLVNPGFGVSTPAVFRARDPGFSEPLDMASGWSGLPQFVDWLANARNDLEAAALTLCPVVGDALAWLRATPGCLLARMSGSGATCYGVFARAPEIGRLPAGWWSSTGLRNTVSGA